MVNIKKGFKRVYIVLSIMISIIFCIFIISNISNKSESILLLMTPLLFIELMLLLKLIDCFRVVFINLKILKKASWCLSIMTSIPILFYLFYDFINNNSLPIVDILLNVVIYGSVITISSLIICYYLFRLIFIIIKWIYDGFKDKEVNVTDNEAQQNCKNEINKNILLVSLMILPVTLLILIQQYQVKCLKEIGREEYNNLSEQFINFEVNAYYDVIFDEFKKVSESPADILVSNFQILENEVSPTLYMYINDKYPSSFIFRDNYFDYISWPSENDINKFFRILNNNVKTETVEMFEYRLPNNAEWAYVIRNDNDEMINNNINFYGLKSMYDERCELIDYSCSFVKPLSDVIKRNRFNDKWFRIVRQNYNEFR